MIRHGLAGSLLLTVIVAGCSNPGAESKPLRVKVHNATLVAEEGSDEGIRMADGSQDVKDGKRTDYFDGTGKLFQAPGSTRHLERAADGRLNFKFTNTDIKVVLDAVLVEAMGGSYTIDPSVRGQISLETSRPVHADDAFVALESAMKIRGFAIVPQGDRWHVLPLSQAPRNIAGFLSDHPDSADLPGFAVELVPLKFSSASEMRKVLEPFAPQGGIIKADNERQMLILAGTSSELAAMHKVIATFDLDWMAGMSFALYDLENADAEEFAKELLDIFADADSPVAGTVRLIPIPRLNKILGIAPEPTMLRHVEAWIERLDVGGEASGRRIYVYHVQNGRSADLAASLGAILGGQQSGGSYGEGPVSSPARSSLSSANMQSGGVAGETGSQPPAASGSFGQSRIAGNSAVYEGAGIRIVPNEENNSLLIMASPDEYAMVESALEKLDLPPRQVLIEAQLAEVTLTDELRYGVQWHFEEGRAEYTLVDNGSGQPLSSFPGYSYAFRGNKAQVVLNALEGITDVNVLSSPKLMVLNNQAATLQVGDEVPVPVQTSQGTLSSDSPIVNSVEYRETGVILSVTPRINKGGLVLLDITQEVSDVAATTSSGIDAPTIQQRKITSTVAVKNGQTLALGGLIRESQSKTRTGVPVLQHIPLLGNAFKSTNTVDRRTELIILITPRVIRNDAETKEVMDYLQDSFRAVMPQDSQDDEGQ